MCNSVSCFSDLTMSNREIREELLKRDIILCKSAASEHASLRHFNHICQWSDWIALWDSALEHGTQGASRTLALLRAFPQPLFSDRTCPLQDDLEDDQIWKLLPNITAPEHFCSKHNNFTQSVENRHNSYYDEQLHLPIRIFSLCCGCTQLPLLVCDLPEWII